MLLQSHFEYYNLKHQESYALVGKVDIKNFKAQEGVRTVCLQTRHQFFEHWIFKSQFHENFH